MQKHVEQIDRETGESNARMYGLHTLQAKTYREMVHGIQDSFEEIAKDPEMTGETYKVLMYL